MKNVNRALLLAILATLVLAPLAWADETTGEVAVGVDVIAEPDIQNKAGEYRNDDDDAAFFAWYAIHFGDDGYLDLDLSYRSEYEQFHKLRWDASNSFRVEGSFQRFNHWLPHDPMANLAATDKEGKVVRHDDLDPNEVYNTRWEEGKAALIYQPEQAREWTAALKVRQMKRSGAHQNRSTGHCMTCHVVGQTQAVAEVTQDVKAVVGYRKADWGVTYSATVRSYEDDADAVRRYFEFAQHPVKKVPVFGNRVQFSDVTKTVGDVVANDSIYHNLYAYWTSGTTHVDGAAAYYNTEADVSGLSTDYLSLRGRVRHKLSNNRSAVAFHARFEDLSSDDIFIDTVEPISTAGPTAGTTYREFYGFNPDFTRRSARDRSILSAQADYILRYGADRKQRVKLSLKGRDTDRDNRRVDDDNSTSTREYTLKSLFTGRVGKTRYRATAYYKQADDVFKNVNGAVRGAELTSNPGGVGPWTLEQYYDLYATRFGDMSNVPTDSYGLSGNLTYSPASKTSLTFHGTWKDEKNDETDVGDWSRDYKALGASVWHALTERTYVVASMDTIQEDQEAFFAIPLMNG